MTVTAEEMMHRIRRMHEALRAESERSERAFRERDIWKNAAHNHHHSNLKRCEVCELAKRQAKEVAQKVAAL